MRTTAVVAAVGAAYFASALFGLTLAFAAEQVTVVWPPTGIALAALLLLGRASLPGIWLGALAANYTIGEPLVTAFGIATGNTLEAVTAVWLLRRAGFIPALERLRDVLALLGLAAAAAPAVSATLGVLSLCATGIQPWSAFGPLWRVWWLGDAMGVLLAGPFLLTWLRARRLAWSAARAAEAGVLFAALGAVCLLVFMGLGAMAAGPHLVYAVFPFVIWSALRFGQRETATALLLIEVLAVAGAIGGHGPFAAASAHERLILLQVFMAVTAATSLLLGAAMAERRTAEGRRAALMAELERALAAKDEFLAVLGHELRNPLAPLRNAAEILSARAAADPAIERIQRIIERQVAHMVRLVDDLLDASRIARGRVELRRGRVALAEVVAQAVDGVRPLADERGQEVSVDVPADPLVVDGDPVRLEQVVSNLLRNAVRYTEERGRIAVRLAREGDEAVLRVTDDGIGIPPEMLERIFELFVQGERPRHRPAEGLGIGLTLVRDLVELHGGRVAARSDGPGRGSEFTVRLPLAEAAPAASLPTPDAPAAEGVPGRVLVVDDNADAAETLAMVLQDRGYEVVTAYDGAAALAEAEAGAYEFIFLDIALPGGLDGYEVARRIRRDARLRDVTLIALTGFGQEDDRRRAAEAGFDHHVAKPIDPAILRGLLAG